MRRWRGNIVQRLISTNSPARLTRINLNRHYSIDRNQDSLLLNNIKHLCHQHKPFEAQQLVHDVELTPSLCVDFIKMYTSLRQASQTTDWVNKMLNFPLDSKNCNIALLALIKAGFYNLASDLISGMTTQNIKVSSYATGLCIHESVKMYLRPIDLAKMISENPNLLNITNFRYSLYEGHKEHIESLITQKDYKGSIDYIMSLKGQHFTKFSCHLLKLLVSQRIPREDLITLVMPLTKNNRKSSYFLVYATSIDDATLFSKTVNKMDLSKSDDYTIFVLWFGILHFLRKQAPLSVPDLYKLTQLTVQSSGVTEKLIYLISCSLYEANQTNQLEDFLNYCIKSKLHIPTMLFEKFEIPDQDISNLMKLINRN